VGNIFISYRREDSAATCGRMYDRMKAYFGAQAVFKDVDNIPPGADFPQYLQGVLRRCAVLLAVIGPQWLDARTAEGRRRLDDPGDFVRIEIETALSEGVTVIPVLVQGASMPPATELPPSLRPLAMRNASPVRNDPDFTTDMQRLLQALERWVVRAAPADLPSVAQPLGAVGVAAPARPLAPPVTRGASRAMGGVCAVIALVVVAAFVGVAIVFSQALGSMFHNLPGLGGTSTTGAGNTLTAFCGALHNGDNADAYKYLSESFQSRVGAPDQIPSSLLTGTKNSDQSPAQATDCSKFMDFEVNGTSATDIVDVTYTDPHLGQVSPPRKFKFIEVGGAWYIDDVVNA